MVSWCFLLVTEYSSIYSSLAYCGLGCLEVQNGVIDIKGYKVCAVLIKVGINIRVFSMSPANSSKLLHMTNSGHIHTQDEDQLNFHNSSICIDGKPEQILITPEYIFIIYKVSCKTQHS